MSLKCGSHLSFHWKDCELSSEADARNDDSSPGRPGKLVNKKALEISEANY